MPSADLCTEEEVSQLVHTFYDNVRNDAVLGPIFERNVKDWSAHLPKMVDFWSLALRGTARFHGTPMPKHAVPNVLSMMAVVGYLFESSPVRLYNAYLLDDQERLGQSLVWIAAAIGLAWLGGVVRALILRDTPAMLPAPSSEGSCTAQIHERTT
ncbi:MAG: group III truncated hemoglobin [Polaromonas sp.]